MAEKLFCNKCGAEEHLVYNAKVNAALKQWNFCYTCNFWFEKWKTSLTCPQNDSIRIDGNHYQALPIPRDPGKFLGCAGRRFVIKFDNGPELVTNNLWCQGPIPKIWQDKLPDNAKFVR
jgi:hypothetical protein